MLRVKYYAYGSNIDIERLRGRVETFSQPVNVGTPYTLRDYKLVFNAGLAYSDSAFANIVYEQGSEVEGILYDLTPKQFRELDGYEAFYEKQYFRLNQETLGCVYIAKQENTINKRCKPSLFYLNIIIDGCKNSGLNKTYHELVDYKLKNYKLKRNKHKL